MRGAENCSVILAKVTGIDPAAQTVMTDRGSVPYDYLVLATGARHAYFGHDEWEAAAPGLKKIEDATEIRRRILIAFERAETETDAAHRLRFSCDGESGKRFFLCDQSKKKLRVCHRVRMGENIP